MSEPAQNDPGPASTDQFGTSTDVDEAPPSPLAEVEAPVRAIESDGGASGGTSPSYVFFGALAALGLMADVLSKAWAEITLSARPLHDPAIVLVEKHLSFNLAYNRGGAWGLLQNENEMVRRPFFLCVSIAAVVFIVSLYSRLAPGQRALKWGLPLVLGGALGNLTDRVVRTSVVDFIDYRADWITRMNEGIATVVHSWNVTDHWPTFNVADMCICTGVALMAIDMMGSKQPPAPNHAPPPAAVAA